MKLTRKLDQALMDVLMYFPDQKSRYLASDIRAGIKPASDKLLRFLLKRIKKKHWQNIRAIARLREALSPGKRDKLPVRRKVRVVMKKRKVVR